MDTDGRSECDAPVLAPPIIDAAAVVHSASRVDASLLCRNCGYELRGLANDRNCPECGQAIIDSLDRESLAHSSRPWLRRVALGCRLMTFGMVGNVLFGGAQYIITIALGGVNSFHAIIYCHIASVALTAGGGWLVTTREPARGDKRRISARRIARAGFVLEIICMAITHLLYAFNPLPASSALDWTLWMVEYIIVLGVCWPIYCLFLSRTARRVPSRAVAIQLRSLAPASICAIALYVLSWAAIYSMSLFSAFATQDIMTGYSVASWIATISWGFLLLFQAWAAVLHSLLGRKLRKLSLARAAVTHDLQ